MKALVVKKPGFLEVMDVEEPTMGPYDARCEMLYGATCTGTDLHVIDGKFAEHVDYPSIIGHESIGRVLEVGEKVRYLKKGDLVTRVLTRESADGKMKLSWGGMCEFGLACDWKAMMEDGVDEKKAKYYQINKVIPEGLIDPMNATMIITWREYLSYIQRIGVKEGEIVLISGSGANGISLGAMARLCGAAEVIMVGSENRRKAALKAGITSYYNYREEADIRYIQKKYSSSLDYIIDATGKSESMNPYLGCLKAGGVVGVYGMDDLNTYAMNPTLVKADFYRVYNGGYLEPETHDRVIEFIREGKLDASVWIDQEHIFTWENAPEAYEYVRAKKAIKTVIRLSQGGK